MVAAFYSKSPAARAAWLQARLPKDRVVLHLHPKNLPRLPLHGRVVAVPYEEITKRQTWLRVNALIDDRAVLALENPSRYPKITSEKVCFLQRLAMRLPDRLLTDIVPFTLSIEYLYTPFSYLGREILGFPHWYAFRENYQEIDEEGHVVNSLDMKVLAEKIRTVATIDYPAFLCQDRSTVRFSEAPEEAARYQALRAELFASETSPQKLITGLADLTHGFASRTECLLSVLAEVPRPAVVVTNLAAYATRAEAAARKAGLDGVRCTSYALGAGDREALAGAATLIYLEAPIVRSFLLLDIEAALPAGCRVVHVQGAQRVDAYLSANMHHELDSIDQFTRLLAGEGPA